MASYKEKLAETNAKVEALLGYGPRDKNNKLTRQLKMADGKTYNVSLDLYNGIVNNNISDDLYNRLSDSEKNIVDQKVDLIVDGTNYGRTTMRGLMRAGKYDLNGYKAYDYEEQNTLDNFRLNYKVPITSSDGKNTYDISPFDLKAIDDRRAERKSYSQSLNDNKNNWVGEKTELQTRREQDKFKQSPSLKQRMSTEGYEAYQNYKAYEDELARIKYTEQYIKDNNLGDLVKRYGIDPLNFGDADFEKWRKQHHIKYEGTVNEGTESSDVYLASEKDGNFFELLFGTADNLASDQELKDAERLWALSKNNERIKSSQKDLGGVYSFVGGLANGASFGLWDAGNAAREKLEHKQAGLTEDSFVSTPQSLARTYNEHEFAYGGGQLAGTVIASMGVGGLVSGGLKAAGWKVGTATIAREATVQGLTGVLRGGITTATSGGDWSDIGTNALREGLTGALGGAAGGFAEKGLTKLLNNFKYATSTLGKLKNLKVTAYGVNAVGGITDALADYRTDQLFVGIANNVFDANLQERTGKDLLTDFAVSLVLGTAMNIGQNTKAGVEARVEDIVNRYGAEYMKYTEKINGADADAKIKAGEEFIETTQNFKKEMNEQLFPGKAKEVETLHEMLDVAIDSTKMDMERARGGETKTKTPVSTETSVSPKPTTPTVTKIVSTEGGVVKEDINGVIERIQNGTATNKDFEMFGSSKASNRKMLEDAMGVKLPATNSETRKFLRELPGKLNPTSDNIISRVGDSEKASIETSIEKIKNTFEGMGKDAEQLIVKVSNMADETVSNIKQVFGIDVEYGKILDTNLKALADNPDNIISESFDDNVFVKGYADAIGSKLNGITPGALKNSYFGNAPINAKIAEGFREIVDSSAERLKAVYDYVPASPTSGMVEGETPNTRTVIPTYEEYKAEIEKHYPGIDEKYIQERYNARYSVAASPDVKSEATDIRIEVTNKVPSELEKTVKSVKVLTGIDIVFGNRYADGEIDANFRGLFDGKKIIVSENATKADVFNAVVLHELTHGIEGTKKYKGIYDYVLKEMYGNDTARLDADVKEKIAEYKKNGIELTPEKAKGEIVAENVGKYIFADDVGSIVAKNYTLGQKILDVINELIYNIKKKFGNTFELDELAAAQRKYRMALDEVKRNGVQNADGKYLVETIPGTNKKYVKFGRELKLGNNREEWSANIEKYIKDNITKNGSITVVTEDGDSIVINGRTAWKIADVQKTVDGVKVPMSDDELRVKYEAGAHIDELVGISKRGKETAPDDGSHKWADEWNYRTVFFEDSKGDKYRMRISVGINPDEAAAYNIGDIQKRGYHRNGPSSAISDGGALNGDAPREIVYHDKSKTSSEGKTDFEIAYEKALGKSEGEGQYSFGDDATYSQQFIRWFGDWLKNPQKASKIVNEDGTPMVVYHGTDAKFNVFDMGKGRANMDIQGSFFSPWELDAQGYGGNVGAYYLNIKNPADGATAYAALNRFKGQDNAGVKAKEYLIKQGYDGVNFYDEEYVAFYPTQIKSATDNIGTFDRNNPDFRYSFASQNDIDSALADFEAHYGDMYRGMVEQYGTIKPGEIPQVENVKVPKKSGKRQYVSNYARTMAETKVFSDAMQGEFEKMVVDGTLSHERISNKSAESDASSRIVRLGFEGAVNEFETLVNTGRLNKNDIALGQTLLNVACQNKDVELAKKLAVDLSMAATQFGQNVQAFSMLKRMSPDGQLYYLEKTVQKINDDIVKKYNGKKSEVEIDNKLAEDLLNAKNQDEINEAVHAIEKNIGEQMPANWVDKWNAWRYLAMLGNTRTHFRNIVGNMGFVPARKLKDLIGTTIEKVVLPKNERTKSYTKTKESKEFAKQDFKKMSEVIKGNEGKYDTQRGIEEHRQIFETKWLEAVRKFNSDALEWEDGLFLEVAYKDAFAQAMTARGLTSDYLSSGTKEANADLQKIREYAINEAQKATYRDSNAFSEFVKKFGFKGDNVVSKTANVLVEGILPFKKTPANILVRGVEYSPAGLMKTIIADSYKLKKGDISASKYIDNLSSGLTGTGIAALGAFLSHLGILVVSPDEDEDIASYKKMMGAQNYALKFGDNTYTIDWMAPSSLPLFVGAEAYNTAKSTEGFTFKNVTDAMSRISEPMFELSCLSGVQDALESIKYAEDGNTVTSLIADVVASYVSQALPTIGGQFARTIDDTQRNAYYKDKKSTLPVVVESFINKAKAKIPFVSKMLPEKIDRWGRTQKYGGTGERVLENFVSPGYYSKEAPTWTDKRIMEIYKNTGNKSVIPKNASKSFEVNGNMVYLSPDEYVEYSKTKGQLSYKYVTEFLKIPSNIDDETRVEIISAIYEYSNAKAKEKVSDYELSAKYQKVDDAMKKGISPAKYYFKYYKNKKKD